jgi:hypothetical protein
MASSARLGPYVAWVDKGVGLLCGWGFNAAITRIAHIHGTGALRDRLLGALTVTAYAVSQLASATNVRMRGAVCRVRLSERGAKAVARFMLTSSVLSVGWAWEGLSEQVQCEVRSGVGVGCDGCGREGGWGWLRVGGWVACGWVV